VTGPTVDGPRIFTKCGQQGTGKKIVMRIFVALDIDDDIRERILRFMEGVRGFAPDARWVRPESLHVTLKFIGEKPAQTVDEIKQALCRVQSEMFDLALRGYGFFPTPKAARVFWIGIESGPQLAALAREIDDITSTFGVPREDHAFSPHLTLARGGGRSGAPGWRKGDTANRNFHVLQEKLSALPAPEFGTMTAREFFVYESKLMRGGSQYSKLARFALGSTSAK
jgi:RNA 2',3'-cyclic 3'-phosphodiesterase